MESKVGRRMGAALLALGCTVAAPAVGEGWAKGSPWARLGRGSEKEKKVVLIILSRKKNACIIENICIQLGSLLSSKTLIASD